MEIDKQKIDRIIHMSENEFASLVYNVVLQAGADASQARMAMGIAPMIQSRLRSASETDLKKILETVGEEKARGIFDSLQA
ncbi:MAG: hypothetical protein E7616_06855 [Ruminococcaceae bacterium]|nr:hypothetical protein [Oscillospiraceae bacterium]